MVDSPGALSLLMVLLSATELNCCELKHGKERHSEGKTPATYCRPERRTNEFVYGQSSPGTVLTTESSDWTAQLMAASSITQLIPPQSGETHGLI